MTLRRCTARDVRDRGAGIARSLLRRGRVVVAAGALIAAAGAAVAAERDVAAATLLDAYRLAQENDAPLAIAHAEYAAVAEGVDLARANLYQPSIQFNARAGNTDQTTDSEFGVSGRSRFATRQYSVNLSQPIFHYDRYVERAQAEQRARQAEAALRAARQDLIIRVAERYFEVLAASDQLAFARAEAQALARQLTHTQQRFDAGFLAATDLQEMRAGADVARAQEVEAARRASRARETFRAVVGSYPDALPRFGVRVPRAVPTPDQIEWWQQQALQTNPNLIAAEAAMAEAREEVRRQHAGHLPTLDFVAGWNDSTEGGRFPSTINGTSVGVEFALPIYSGGQTSVRTRQAGHRYRQALARLDQQRRDVMQQVQEAYSGIASTIAQIDAAEQATASSALALKMTRLGFDAGTRTALDVVNAERALYRAKRDETRAILDYLTVSLKLRQAAGLLSDADLAEMSAWADAPDERRT